MHHREVTVESSYLARMETGADWREEIESLARAEDVTAGWFTAMGAVRDAEVWFYDQRDKEYRAVTFDEPLEVAACVGNISLLNDDVFAHTHVVLSRESGQALAGHLDTARVFAGEVYLQAFEEPLERRFDERTRLDLWLDDADEHGESSEPAE